MCRLLVAVLIRSIWLYTAPELGQVVRVPQRLRVRQNPVASFFGGVVGIVFFIVGMIFVIPHAGAFGMVWTLLALAGAVTSFYNALSNRGIADRIIDVPDAHAATAWQSADAETRLRQLDDLKNKGLLTPAEYQERRRKILETLC